jgi:hypothetical protein
MARALRAAMEHDVIAETDFEGTDRALFEHIRAAEVPEVQRWLALLRPDVDFARVIAFDSTTVDLTALPKVRAVDPPVLSEGQVAPLSRLDATFAQYREAYVAGKQGMWQLRILA